MRKLVLSALALFLSVGLVVAADVVFVKFDKEKKELTVKEDDKEKTYKVSDKTTFKSGDKSIASDKAMERLEKMSANEKAKGKMKMKITTDKDEVTEVEFPMGKKK